MDHCGQVQPSTGKSPLAARDETTTRHLIMVQHPNKVPSPSCRSFGEQVTTTGSTIVMGTLKKYG